MYPKKRETASSQLKDDPGNLLSWNRLCRSIPSGIEASPEGTEALQLKLQGPCGLYGTSVSCVLLPLATNGHSLRSERGLSVTPHDRVQERWCSVIVRFVQCHLEILYPYTGGLRQQTFEPTKAILSSQSCLNVVGDKVRERELVLQYNANSHKYFGNSQNPTTSTILLQ